jgi:hypothetical protein
MIFQKLNIILALLTQRDKHIYAHTSFILIKMFHLHSQHDNLILIRLNDDNGTRCTFHKVCVARTN